ncbi:hypothetical protein D3C73_1384790 [compost metagenome]
MSRADHNAIAHFERDEPCDEPTNRDPGVIHRYPARGRCGPDILDADEVAAAPKAHCRLHPAIEQKGNQRQLDARDPQRFDSARIRRLRFPFAKLFFPGIAGGLSNPIPKRQREE